MLPLLVSIGFQVLFHSPPGVLFTFPSRYYFSIGHQGVFSLGRWSSLLPTGFLVSRGTLEHNLWIIHFVYRIITFYDETSQSSSTTHYSSFTMSVTPNKFGLGCFPFARRYLGNRCFFLFLRVLRCFSSPGLPLCTYFIGYKVLEVKLKRVSPFGNLRINVYLRLPEAYRCLSRPSSALGAKASALRS